MKNFNNQALCVTNEEVIKLCLQSLPGQKDDSEASTFIQQKKHRETCLIRSSLTVSLCCMFLKCLFGSLIFVLSLRLLGRETFL